MLTKATSRFSGPPAARHAGETWRNLTLEILNWSLKWSPVFSIKNLKICWSDHDQTWLGNPGNPCCLAPSDQTPAGWSLKLDAMGWYLRYEWGANYTSYIASFFEWMCIDYYIVILFIIYIFHSCMVLYPMNHPIRSTSRHGVFFRRVFQIFCEHLVKGVSSRAAVALRLWGVPWYGFHESGIPMVGFIDVPNSHWLVD